MKKHLFRFVALLFATVVNVSFASCDKRDDTEEDSVRTIQVTTLIVIKGNNPTYAEKGRIDTLQTILYERANSILGILYSIETEGGQITDAAASANADRLKNDTSFRETLNKAFDLPCVESVHYQMLYQMKIIKEVHLYK